MDSRKKVTVGWLDRRGKFREVFGYQAHLCYADSIGKSEETLEDMGWVKVTHQFDGKPLAIWTADRLTKAQVKYLVDVGFDVDEDSFIGYITQE